MADFQRAFPDGLALRILGYREEGEWVALALEMDLRGYGETFEEAKAELEDLVRMQVSFALSKNAPEMVWRDAEPVWFGRYEAGRREMLRAAVSSVALSREELELSELPIPVLSSTAGTHSGFQQSGA